MSSPSLSEIQDQWGKATKVLNELRKFAGTHTATGGVIDVDDNYLNMEDALVQALEGEFAGEKLSAMYDFRARLNAALSAAPSVLEPHLREYVKMAGYPETAIQSMLTRIWEYMIDNSYSVVSRDFVFGTPAAGGSNVGTGTINRFTKDEEDLDIENQSATSSGSGMLKTAECISDEHSGAREHEELFRFYGPAPDRDFLRIVGIPTEGVIKALSAADSKAYIQNPSFEEHGGTDDSVFTASTQLTGWTMSDYTKVTPITSDYYRDYEGVATPKAISLSDNCYIEQNLNNIRARINPRVPMYLHVAFKRASSCDGTLTMTLGSQSVAVTLAAQSGWTLLKLGPGDENWFKVWNQENPTLKLALTSRTTGSLYLDDIVFAPATAWDGGFYAVVGSATPFLRDDKFTWYDYVPTSEGIIQHWVYRAFGRYLPHASSSNATWADPT